MTKLTPKEILAKISDNLEANPDALDKLKGMIEDYCDYDEDEDGINFIDIINGLTCSEGTLNGIGKYIPDLELLEEYTKDDYGSEAHVAFRYKPTDQIVGYEGWYSSEESFDFDDFGFVEMEPYQVTHYRKARK